MNIADRFSGIEISLIRQINALATSNTINLGIGEPNLDPDETLREMARQAAAVPWRYSPNAGHPSLRTRVAETIAPDFDPKSEICITAGTQEALYAIFQAYVNPGDEVLVPDPGFLAYATLARICGATAVPYALEPPSWTIEVGSMKFSAKTKLVVVNSPSNPLGSIVPRPTLEEIARRAADHGALAVSDEVYREIWYEEEPASMAGTGGNVIVVGGMSKSHGMTGLRLGWAIARENVMKPVVIAHQSIATCASVFSQALAERILGAPEWNAEWLAAMRAQFRDQREAAVYALEHELGIRVDPPSGAFYLFSPAPSCDTVAFAKSAATDAAVLVIPGVAFGKGGEGFIRISFAAPTQQIAAGIERLGRWLRQSGR